MLLYHSATSPYARKVRVLLREKGIAHESIDVVASGRSASEHNPLDKVPTLVLDDGSVLFDSCVIAEALEALYPEPRLMPAAPLDRARVRRWEALADGLCDVLIPVVLERRRPPERQDRAYADKLEGKARACLHFAESELGGRTQIGDAFSYADIALVSALGYVTLRRPQLLDGHAGLARYVERQLERPSLAETVPPHRPIPG